MRKTTLLVTALALVLGLTQCKKEQTNNTQSEGNGVMITLNVDGGDSGSRVEVIPPHVTFEDGDQILVASNGAVVGTLNRENGIFSGEITDPTEGQRLYFYFLGNKQGTVANGTTTCTVNISEQTSELPVISMGKSTVDYSTNVTNYTSRLYNKCSLMKFNVTTLSNAAICITGMNNKVTVHFDNPTNSGFEYGMNTTDGGLITMPAKDENNVTWAIVLPQEALAAGEEGSTYTEGYTGTRPAMEAIEMNKFLADGIALTVNTPAAPAVRLLSEATAADCGMVVCADGHLHPAKTAVPSGCTAVGILGKVTDTGHGLILALWDATYQKWNTINGWNSVTTYAGTTLKVLPDDARGDYLTSYTTLGETTVSNWAVAQKSDYEAIFTNLGSTTSDEDGTTYDAHVNAYFTTGVGGSGFTTTYWSATVATEYADYGDFAWLITSDYWAPRGKTWNGNVRPVLGF